MSFETGSLCVGTGLAILQLVFPMLGITPPKFVSIGLLGISILLIFIWPVSWMLDLVQANLKLGRLTAILMFIAVGALVGAAVFGGVAYKTIDDKYTTSEEQQGPIQWTFDLNSPLGHSRRYSEPLWIDAFQIKGTNASNNPISPTKALVRSDITNATLPLQFSTRGKLVPVVEVTIPPQANFILISVIPSTDPSHTRGIVVDKFREEFKRFTLIFEHDGKQIVRHFSETEIEGFITSADRATRKALAKPTTDVVLKKLTKKSITKKEIREALGKFHHEGIAIQVQCETDSAATEDAIYKRFAVWDGETQKYLKANLDLSYATRFSDPAGIPLTEPPSMSPARMKYWGYVYNRNVRLMQFMEDFKESS